MNLHAQDREILANSADVEAAFAHCRMHGLLPFVEPTEHDIRQSLANCLILNGLDDGASEGLDQERLGVLGREPARHQIETKLLIDRTGRGAMAALDVVREDLQFGLAVGFGLVR